MLLICRGHFHAPIECLAVGSGVAGDRLAGPAALNTAKTIECPACFENDERLAKAVLDPIGPKLKKLIWGEPLSRHNFVWTRIPI